MASFSIVHTRVLADTHHCLDVPSIELEKLDCTKEVRDLIRASDRVYTDIKDSNEVVVNIAWVELHRKICYFGLRASSLFHMALFKVKVITSVSSECIMPRFLWACLA